MQIIKLCRGVGANVYVLTADGKNAVVIDPSYPSLVKELEKRGLTAAYVLLTHCHFDHVYGVPALQQAGAKVLCSDLEKPLVGTPAALSGLFGAPDPDYTVDGTFTDGEILSLCGVNIKVMLTPGHTAGSATFFVTDEDGKTHLITGDTLFEGSIGRTDFPTGDMATLRKSLKKLKELDGDYPVYAGHGDDTTLDRERKYNPFLCDV